MTRDPFAAHAMPLLRRLDDRWQDEATATHQLTFAVGRIASAERGGFIERRRHWLTGRAQIRLVVPAYRKPRLGLVSNA